MWGEVREEEGSEGGLREDLLVGVVGGDFVAGLFLAADLGAGCVGGFVVCARRGCGATRRTLIGLRGEGEGEVAERLAVADARIEGWREGKVEERLGALAEVTRIGRSWNIDVGVEGAEDVTVGLGGDEKVTLRFLSCDEGVAGGDGEGECGSGEGRIMDRWGDEGVEWDGSGGDRG